MESGPPASVFVAHKELTEKSESEELLALPVHQLKVTKVKRATREIKERKASKENAAQPATPVHKVQQDPQVLPELQAQLAQLDLRVHRAQLDLRALLERLVHKELKARRVTKEIPEVLTLAGAAGEPITSDTFGTLLSDSNYQVDLVISGSGTSDISVLPLHFEVITSGGSRSITNVQWTNASVQTLRNGSSIAIEHTIQARFAVNGSGTGTNVNLQVRLKAGASTATKPVTFVGNYRMQKVGSVAQE